MSIIFLFNFVLILTTISRVVESDINTHSSENDTETTLEAENKTTKYSATIKTLINNKNYKMDEETNNITNRNQTPILLNLIINLNIKTEPEKKQTKRNKNHGKIFKLKKVTREKVTEKPQYTDSELLARVFERMKMKMENQRKKRDLDMKLEDNEIQNITETDKMGYISINDFTVLNKDEENDASRWLKNWKDILAIDPVLGTEKPTQPDAEFIDEWRYSYRVTLFNSDKYNISNFACSGLLISKQWVLTSMSCKLGEDVTLLIGVHKLPDTVLEHNRYRASTKVYSLKENLELIKMDRPVEWKFTMPEIGSVKTAEMENLLRRKRCKLLSWIPVDLDKNIFELRQYPQLLFWPEAPRNPTKNTITVSPSQHYRISKKDLGSPVLCDDLVVGIVLEVGELEDCMTMELLCPVLEWATFFTKEKAYFEVAARKITMRNSAKGTEDFLLVSILFFCLYTAG